jgi:hypothetical protein
MRVVVFDRARPSRTQRNRRTWTPAAGLEARPTREQYAAFGQNWPPHKTKLTHYSISIPAQGDQMAIKAKAAPVSGAKTARIPIVNVYMDGDYTGVIKVGSQGKAANVILDTGSSTLALDGNFYDPSTDKNAKVTDLAQEVQYGSGAWVGAVVLTDIGIGSGAQAIALQQVNTAVAYAESKDMFAKANGILGLAYTRLNRVFTMPGPTWPAKYSYNQIQQGRSTFLDPYFTEMEAAGGVANKFAFYTKRSMVSNATAKALSDTLNQGFLILGGGEESTDLYTGKFQSVSVLDDAWYNTNLKAVIVGNTAPIEVPAPTKASQNLTNSIVDSGTNSLMLDAELFKTVADRFTSGENTELTDAMRSGYLKTSSLNLAKWPAIAFVMQGPAGDVKLTVTPENYWQSDAPKKGYSSAAIYSDNGQLQGQSILGLPLMNGYFTIFDRSVDKGLGVINFATRK